MTSSSWIIRLRWPLFALACLLIVTPPLARTLLLMPIVPGIQEYDTIPFAYAIHAIRWELMIAGTLVLLLLLPTLWPRSRWPGRTIVVTTVALLMAIHAAAALRFSAEAMFAEPSVLTFTPLSTPTSSLDDADEAIVVTIDGVTKAYPIDLLAHHHKVMDRLGSTPVMVTYCTMCHTGRVYASTVDGTETTFRLVGANQYNAILEDRATGSWWYQATGTGIAGPRTGHQLADLAFEQVTIGSLRRRPGTVLVMQADPSMRDDVRWASGFSRRRDTSSAMADRSLVIGTTIDGIDHCFPMTALQPGLSVIHLDGDSLVAHVDAYGSIRLWSLAPAYTLDRLSGDTVVVHGADGHPATMSLQPGADARPALIVRPMYMDRFRAWKTFHPSTRVVSS